MRTRWEVSVWLCLLWNFFINVIDANLFREMRVTLHTGTVEAACIQPCSRWRPCLNPGIETLDSLNKVVQHLFWRQTIRPLLKPSSKSIGLTSKD